MLLLISCVVIGVLAGLSDEGKIFKVLSHQIIVTAALMPLTGFICGYILSTLFSMNAPYVCPPYGIEMFLAEIQIHYQDNQPD